MTVSRSQPARSATLPQRLARRVTVDPDTGCHNWTGWCPRGYGLIRPHGGAMRWMTTHRAAYILARGEPAPGLVIDHLCRNTRCCNPDHLEAVTVRENGLRGVGLQARNAAATHCPQGHPYDEENTQITRRGWRRCAACSRAEAYARWIAKKGAAKQ